MRRSGSSILREDVVARKCFSNVPNTYFEKRLGICNTPLEAQPDRAVRQAQRLLRLAQSLPPNREAVDRDELIPMPNVLVRSAAAGANLQWCVGARVEL